MDKIEFNKYCAEVMGHETYYIKGVFGIFNCARSGNYNPFNDANQRHEVFNKLWQLPNIGTKREQFILDVHLHGIDKAEREFIWSTKENNDDKV